MKKVYFIQSIKFELSNFNLKNKKNKKGSLVANYI